ncbi:NaeI family type II restriction endonuclease [Streptomyces mirabilis]|uniref:NaeI family type II restriction endonuclease n=1 Tax=Streptomyces mirabilis TaxID=68239 RepID=UPI0036B90CB9
MSSIVLLLREVMDESGIGLRGLAEKLRTEHREGPLPRGYQTLSKRLRGTGLQNEPHLIHAIISACTEGDRQKHVTARVTELLADARGAAATAGGAPRKQPTATDRQLVDALAEINTLRKKMERLRSRAERAEKKLMKARELLAAGSRETPVHPPPRKRTVGESGTPFASAPQQPTAIPAPRETPAAQATPAPLLQKDSASAEGVITFLNAVPDLQRRTASSLRAAFDSVLDGERTGRYDLAKLNKSEKTYLGSRVEHFLWQAWGLNRRNVDSRLRHVPLRFTWTSTWMLGPEHVGSVCLLVRASDSESRWSLGVLAVAPEHLNRLKSNRDGKMTLSVAGKSAIHWLFEDAALPENALLHLDQPTLAQVFSPTDDAAADHAQGRTNNLFRAVQGRLLDHSAVRTVAMDPDSPRRVREARRNLLAEGILLLGHQGDQPRIATALGLPRPNKGEWVSVRVARRYPGDGDAPFVEINGDEWRSAAPDDPVESAPYVY